MNTRTDFAAQLALFLLGKTGTVLGVWRGYMTAKEQRELFGRFIGKGRIHINGTEETIHMSRKVGFGMDSEQVGHTTWAAL